MPYIKEYDKKYNNVTEYLSELLCENKKWTKIYCIENPSNHGMMIRHDNSYIGKIDLDINSDGSKTIKKVYIFRSNQMDCHYPFSDDYEIINHKLRIFINSKLKELRI